MAAKDESNKTRLQEQENLYRASYSIKMPICRAELSIFACFSWFTSLALCCQPQILDRSCGFLWNHLSQETIVVCNLTQENTQMSNIPCKDMALQGAAGGSNFCKFQIQPRRTSMEKLQFPPSSHLLDDVCRLLRETSSLCAPMSSF